MFKFLTTRHTNKYKTIVNEINTLAKHLKQLSDLELRRQTTILKKEFHRGYSLNKLMVKAFAIVKEATYRLLGFTMFDVQLIGGIVLHEGKIAEMKTGEGKTLVALLPAYLNALSGKGVHIITVNDYLTKRDATWVGKVHEFLGLSVGLIQPNMTYAERKQNYSCDVIYVTNSQLGFDYLKDNMAVSDEETVQRQFYFCIIDEVDSILIDEARTPLIISGLSKSPTDKYIVATKLSSLMKVNIDYEVDEKIKNIILTDRGNIFCEHYLQVDDLYSLNDPWFQYILSSLQAKELFVKNVHYIVQNKIVLIVDEFTGRVMPGRRWSNGLHQAIEAKENIPIQQENKTLASITYQSFFLLYTKLSGMTGTAKTEEAEFDKIYNLEVVVVPTNKPCLRKDFTDLVYKSESSKWKAVASECLDMYCIGRPTLVGTNSIEKSEILAKILNKHSVPYNLLNAKPKNIKKEAEIIAQAGKKSSITIATNMAGRGTDIILGGNLDKFTISTMVYYVSKQLNLLLEDLTILERSPLLLNKETHLLLDKFNVYYNSITKVQISSSFDLENLILSAVKKKSTTTITDNLLQHIYKCIYDQYQENFESEKTTIIKLGGLHVIGTERHESRRIDNQLRGRSGRQGDPGSSRFFLSLEDNLLRVFGGNTLIKVMEALNVEDNAPIESNLINNSLDLAQKKVESYFYDIRKQLIEYDEVLSNQRQAMYAERNKILSSINCRDSIIEYVEITIFELVDKYLLYNHNKNNKLSLLKTIFNILNIVYDYDLCSIINNLSSEKVCSFFYQQIGISYDLQEIYMNKIEEGLIREMEKYYLLQQIDNGWQKHLERMACLRDLINLRGYAQQDPLTEYKRSAFSLFVLMVSYVRQTVTFLIFNTK
uniref:Protein translocase subunit SecA n=1 Tax=Apophlaea sinclairii TaxID=212746 RepID=A0A1C9CBH8_9FLOR|nr:preprotein translocase subunit SecA [Apophlaea sinclairii]AOM65750.1 preprotein translocase subunit SecA [Apophlaea sinclairii]